MRAFAELLDRLSLTASRNAKLVLVRDYLKATPDPDRGWALAALTGDLTFDAAKPAMTHIDVLQRGPSHTLLHCRLETGRTHQIRVHLADAGYPLVGDALYGGKALPSMSRQALHAWRLSLTHPVTGEPCVWRSDPPQDLLDTLQCVGLGYNFAQ